MTDLAFTDTSLNELSIFEHHPFERYTGIASVNLAAGVSVYIDTNGKLAIADANGSGTDKWRGITMYKVNAGQSVSVLRRGTITTYDLAALAFDAPIYLSNTAGKLADAAGGTSLLVARVIAVPDYGGIRKMLHFPNGFVG
jgi:hypothetical protein